MPTPDRTSLDAIIAAARDLLEENGLAGLTMSAVAARVGVRAPSLYKRVPSRDRLLQLVAEATLLELAQRLDATDDLVEGARRFRAYGHERPAAFRMVMAPGAGAPLAGLELRAAASAPIIRAAGALAGEKNALAAARTFTAWASGFVSMELNGGFGLGGDVDEAWDFGVERLIAALSAP